MKSVRAFISYAHESRFHVARVIDFANRLRACGVDAEIDQYEMSPPEGWPTWCERQIEQADRVLLVCTEAYHRRVRNEEEPERGLGVLHEAHIIRQELYDAGGVSTKYVPVLFSDGSDAHVPRPVRCLSRYVIDTDQGFEQLLRLLLTNQPLPRDASPAAPAEPASQAARVFVGRVQEREMLAGLLLRPAGRRLPVVVSGMAGVGKTYLVDRVFDENRGAFPGGYLRLSLDPEALPGAAGLLAQIADRLQLPATGAGAVAARLAAPPTLLHVENIDTGDAGRLVRDLAAALPDAALVFTARLRTLGTSAGWGQIPLDPFGDDDALAQLRAEVGAGAPNQQDWPELVTALGRLPLALHLAAGHLRQGETPTSFLRRLRTKGLALAPVDPADPAFRERSRDLLSATFDLPLAALRRDGGAVGEAWETGLLALGQAAAGVGESLGAAVAGLDEDGFAEMSRAAARLSLLERVTRPDGPAVRLHPLLAELGRSRSDGAAAVARMTDWFCARLPEPEDGQPWRWTEVQAETPALLDWLAQVPPADRLRVVRAGSSFAISTGPFGAWLHFCEAALTGDLEGGERSDVLWTLGNVALSAGLPDRALAAAEAKQELDRCRGADRDAALAASLIADILEARGELDEALRIRRQEELPVYERLGDVRERAVTMGKIADILSARGELDEALRIRQEEELPAFERLGDVRSRAVTMGRIADVLSARGELDEALRIRRQEELPIYEWLGDVRGCAVTMGKIADILEARGELDEALRIRRQEELPVYGRLEDLREQAVTNVKIADVLSARGELDEALSILKDQPLSAFERLGDVRSRAVTMGKIADILTRRGELDEALHIRQEEQLPVYERLDDVRARAVTMGKIADILQSRGELDEALRIRQEEELPVYERLGDVRNLLVGRAILARTLLTRNGDGDREEARRLLCLALADARRLRIPEAEEIEAILARHDLACDPT